MTMSESGRVNGVFLTNEDARLVVTLVDELRVLGRRHGFAVGSKIQRVQRLCADVLLDENPQTSPDDWLLESGQQLIDAVSVQGAAQALGCTPQMVRYLIKKQRLEARKVSGAWIVSTESVRTYRDSRNP